VTSGFAVPGNQSCFNQRQALFKQIPRKLERVTITRKPEAKAADAPDAAAASTGSDTYEGQA
jgi:hypothetical protein